MTQPFQETRIALAKCKLCRLAQRWPQQTMALRVPLKKKQEDQAQPPSRVFVVFGPLVLVQPLETKETVAPFAIKT